MPPIEVTKPDDIFALFESNPEVERTGTWVEVGTSRFLIRSMDAPEVQQVRTKQITRQARIAQASNGILPPATVEANEVELAQAVVMGWQNVPHYDEAARKDGAMLEYTAASAKTLLGMKSMHRLREFLLGQAQTFDNFKREQAKAIEGNFATSSGGSLATAQPQPE